MHYKCVQLRTSVEKNVTLQYKDQCLLKIRVKYSLSFEGARAPPLVPRLASSDECKKSLDMRSRNLL